MTQVRTLELLAPARDTEIAVEAIRHGADAVYIGGPSHGARAAASNSIEALASLTSYAHKFGVRVYVTLNTIIYDDELPAVERTVRRLYDAGIDTLIVQDMSLLRMDIPPIDLHASTQCDIRTPEKARFLGNCGFSQLVLPRELTLDEIRAIRAAVPGHVTLEAFVHGALCVSYSGDCQASCAAKRRSANRGECAQMCRLPYTLTDKDDNILAKDRHLLSLRDLNHLRDIEAMALAGIGSFKIEGRLKDAAYVKNTVAAYREAIDSTISRHPGLFARASYGTSRPTFTPDTSLTFNRGYTPYFLYGTPGPGTSMACLDTPKWTGRPVGKVTGGSGIVIEANLTEVINNGDGLGYFDNDRVFRGVQINRAEISPDRVPGKPFAARLFAAKPVTVPRRATLYRNRDTKKEAMLRGDTAVRKIAVDIELSVSSQATPDSKPVVTLTLIAENGISASSHKQVDTLSPAKQPQTAYREKILGKLGTTDYEPRSVTDRAGDGTFIPASVLTDLRQRASAGLDEALANAHTRKPRLREDIDTKFHQPTLTYHDNVANHLAARFYREHGAEPSGQAMETWTKVPDGTTVMTTRYCLRREFGACLRTPGGRKLPSPLFITNPSATYRLDFDCAACRMHVVIAGPTAR